MKFDKGHREFHTLDMGAGWQTPPAYPRGFKQKILAGELDEKNGRGNRTLRRARSNRFLRRSERTPAVSYSVESLRGLTAIE